MLECLWKFANFYEINLRGVNACLSTFKILQTYCNIPKQYFAGVVLERSSTEII